MRKYLIRSERFNFENANSRLKRKVWCLTMHSSWVILKEIIKYRRNSTFSNYWKFKKVPDFIKIIKRKFVRKF